MKQPGATRGTFVEGETVYLRRPTSDDAQPLIALNRASRRFHRGYAYPPTRLPELAAYIERCHGEAFAGFLVCRREDEAVLGTVNLSQIVYGGFQSGIVGYQIGAPFARKGYMTEAVDLALRVAFTKLALHRIEANIQPSNVASLALVKRLGFTREGFSRHYLKIGGRWRDHERWAILAADWRSRKHQKR